MKKLGVLLLVLLLLTGCTGGETETWNDVHIPEVGSFKIPAEWKYTENEDGVRIITSDNDVICMGIIYENEERLELLSKSYGKEIEYNKAISSAGFSNNAIFGKNGYIIDGEVGEKIFLDLSSLDKSVFFLVIDDSIEYETVEKIAKSFERV